MKRWFMSYVQVYDDGRLAFGSCVLHDREEHPVEMINGWNRDYGKKEGHQYALISFQEVGPEVPEMDVLTAGIS